MHHLDLAGLELVGLLAVQGGHIHPSGNEDVPRVDRNLLQGPLDAVKDAGQQPGAQLH